MIVINIIALIVVLTLFGNECAELKHLRNYEIDEILKK